MRRRIGIGALGVVDEQHIAAAADLLHAVRETGKAAQAVLQGFAGDAERQRAGRSAGGILRVVQAAQGSDAADPRDLAARAAGGAPDDFALDIDAVGSGFFTEMRTTRRPACSIRSAVLRLQPSSTPTIAVPCFCTPATRRSFTAA